MPIYYHVLQGDQGPKEEVQSSPVTCKIEPQTLSAASTTLSQETVIERPV
jgi:hypothetical protein